MSVVYVRSDSIGRKIIPAPVVSINKGYQANKDGTKRGTKYSIVLTGTLLPFAGSPSGSYSSLDQAFHTVGGFPSDEINTGGSANFNSILRKQEALRWLFSEDGGSLEWQPSEGQPPVKCSPRVISINFSEGQWADRCDYTIELEAPWVYINGTSELEDDLSTDLVSASTETWSFEEVEGRNNQQQKISHEVTAEGQLGYDGVGGLHESKQAWEHAKDFVDARTDGTIDSDIMFAALGATNKITGHYNKVTRIDQDGGTYGVTESWLLSDSNTYEERQYTVEYKQDTDEYSVTYQGTIIGVNANDRTGDADNMDKAKAAIPTPEEARVTAIAAVDSLLGEKSIPTHPDKRSVSLNQQDGTVSFTYEWNTSDDSSSFIKEDAQHSYSVDNLLSTLTFTQTVEGKGTSSSEKMTNAKADIYSDSTARTRAKSLASTPPANYFLTSVVKSYDKLAGIVKANWTWTDRDANSTEVTIQTQEKANILATIPIPGRSSGPIVQNMGTLTSEIISVVMRSKRNTSQPNLNTVAYGEGGTIISDSTSWNPITGVAERSTKFLKET